MPDWSEVHQMPGAVAAVDQARALAIERLRDGGSFFVVTTPRGNLWVQDLTVSIADIDDEMRPATRAFLRGVLHHVEQMLEEVE